MERYLILENIRFVILLFGALTFGGMSWLYFDAVSVKKQINVWLSGLGSGLIAAGFLALILGVSWADMIRFLGYFVLGFGVWFKPMSKRPESEMGKEVSVQHEVGNTEGFVVEEVPVVKKKKTKKSFGAWWVMVPANLQSWLLPLLPGVVGLGYFKLATVGLERHLKKLGVGMYLLLGAEVLEMYKYFDSWSDPRIYLAASQFGPLWMVHKVFLFLGLFTISTWVFSYLLKRFETQLTLFLCTMTIFAFAVATIGFTFTTAGNIKERFINYQKMTLELLRYSEERRAQEMLLRAKDLGSRPSVLELYEEGSGELANKEIVELQKNGELSGVWALGADGKTLLSLSNGGVADWAVFGRAVKGESVWGYELEGGVMSLAVAVPIKSSEKNLGVIVLSKKVDSNFLQGMATKVKSGLWVYKQNQVVSYADSDDRVRLLVGLSDTDETFAKEVLTGGVDIVRTSVKMSGEVYMGVWGAMKNTNGTPLGSMAVVSRVDELWKIVEVALIKDYQLAVLSLILSLLPAVLISRYFVKQLA